MPFSELLDPRRKHEVAWDPWAGGSLRVHSHVSTGAGVQLQQDPGVTLRMNGVGKRGRRHVRPALIGPSLRGRERERERGRERERKRVTR